MINVESSVASALSARLDPIVDQLEAGAAQWSSMLLLERIALLADVSSAVEKNAKKWVVQAARIKGLSPSSPLVGEEWISGPYVVLTALSTLRHTLEAISEGRSPLDGRRLGTAPGGRVSVPVLPGSAYEAVLLHGFSAETWMLPGLSRVQVTERAGLGALTPTSSGGVGLVLGAGNISSIPPLDVLYELIAHNRVAVLKLNPVMERMLPVYEAAFAPLISHDVLRIVAGGADVGGYLAHHPGVSHVHITGSAATHDAIVWGPDADSTRASGTPVLHKPITSELGGVAPIIVLPGEWTSQDLVFQAEHVATQRLHNGGYNCIAGQVVVLSSDWPQKKAFVDALRTALAAAPDRPAWYPGSDTRVGGALADYPGAQKIRGGRLLIELHEADAPDALTQTEYFSPVLGLVELPGSGQSFFDAAIDAANERFAGTLGANIIGAPRDIRSLKSGFREGLARLEYGTIGVNAWTAVGFLSAGAPWGAFPGHTIEDVQSGIGVVHNGLLLDGTERTIVRGPFRPFPRSIVHGEFALFPKPPWFVTARSAAKTGRLLTRFAARPSWRRLPSVFASAFRA